MPTIALIDTYVDASFLKNGRIQHISICADEPVKSYRINHGTMCAMIIDRYTADYELYNISILSGNEDSIPRSDIPSLIKAFHICMDVNVDIVSLSAASSFLMHTQPLFEITKSLSKTATIVAALDNKQFVSVPSSYPFVVGVQHDHKGLLSPGETAISVNDPFGVNVYANCDFCWLKKNRFFPSNSFAVPVVTASLHEVMMTSGVSAKDAENTLSTLRPYTALPEIRHSITNRPLVLIDGEDSDSLSLCIQIMDELYDNHGIMASALSLFKTSQDIRIRTFYNWDSLRSEVELMQNHYKTDLIFILINGCNRYAVPTIAEIDLYIKINSSLLITLQSNQKKIIVTSSGISETVYSVLTGEMTSTPSLQLF